MFPIFFGSALKDEGVEEFMEALDLYTCQKKLRYFKWDCF